ncbi:MAG TPA: methyltransferase domain-containing protein [Streptosporangiaceae bacterium]
MRASDDDGYLMGHSAAEARRLRLQAELYAPHTEHLFRLAGIGPGMSVADVGCGPGDVTALIARMVGPAGFVTGIDMDPAMLRAAARDTAAAGLGNVAFREAVLPCVPVEQPVDALVGRLILMHLDDPAAAVRQLARHVRPGGIICFQDVAITATRTVPPLPLAGQCVDWLKAAFRVGGREPDFGERLPAILRAAGFPAPQVAAAVPAGGADSLNYAHLAAGVAVLLPLIEASGVARRCDVAVDTLLPRLQAEARAAAGTLYSAELIGAWVRVPPG